MNVVYLVLLGLAWVVIQCLVGGTILLFSLPAYGLIASAAILSLASVRAPRIAPSGWCLLSTLLLGAWILIRSRHSPVEYLALPDFYMMIGCLMVYLLTIYHLTSQRDRAILLGVLWAVAALAVWCGLVQFVKDPHFMLFGLKRPVTLRATGLFIGPNVFSGYLETVAILALSMAVWSRWPVWAKFLLGYLALMCWVGVAISGSRGGYFATITTLLAFAAGSIYTIRRVNPRQYFAVLIGALAAVAILVCVAAFAMGHSTLLAGRMNTMATRDVRIYIWQAALDHIKVSPWIGTGAGTHRIYGRLYRRPQIQADPVHCHCDYLELIAEYGAVGGVCMLLFLVFHIRNGLGAFSCILRRRLLPSGFARSNSFALNMGALCAVAGLATHSIFDFNMHIPGNALMFAFIFGMLANPGIERSESVVERHILPWGRLLLPALGAWLIYAGLPLLPSEWCAERARVAVRDLKFANSIAYAKIGIGGPSGNAVALTPEQKAELDPPCISWLGGTQALVRRFGPNPSNPDIYFYLGESNRGVASGMLNPFSRMRYFGYACDAYVAGLKVFLQHESMLIRYAQTLDQMLRFKEAEAAYQRALACDPNLEQLYVFYEKHLVAEGKPEEAARLAQERAAVKTVAVDADSNGEAVAAPSPSPTPAQGPITGINSAGIQ